MQLEGLDHIALSVRDVEASAQWYIDVLGFERMHEGMWGGVPLFVGIGGTGVALFPLNARHGDSGRAVSGATTLHFAMRASRSDFLRAQDELRSRGIAFEFQDHEISHSIYFKDPDAYELEITTYEID